MSLRGPDTGAVVISLCAPMSEKRAWRIMSECLEVTLYQFCLYFIGRTSHMTTPNFKGVGEYNSFITEIRGLTTTSLTLFFFSSVSAILSPLLFHMHFRISWSSCMKILIETLIDILLNLWFSLGGYLPI